MIPNERELVRVGDSEVFYDPKTGLNYWRTSACGGALHPMVDRSGQQIVDFHGNDPAAAAQK